MRALAGAAIAAIALTACGGWSPGPTTGALRVGDCLRLEGTARPPVAAKVACGSRASNFKVAATVVARDQCPATSTLPTRCATDSARPAPPAWISTG
ncbi:putative lipoprotein LppU [Mycobacterium xenopi 3993]|nr:putative lipoprotein LppU [Mycobacterium xenopi 3993]